MGKMGRKVLAVVVSLCMMMGVIVVPSDTQKVKAEVFGDFEYQELEDGTVEITKYTGSDAEVTILGTIAGKKVTSIGDYAFSRCKNLTGVMIPNSVTNIGESAFEFCDSLTKIAIPNNVTNIGNNAFYDCSRMTRITIPNGVTSIGDATFSGCVSLTEISIPESVTSMGSSVFAACRSLTEISIPDGVTSIGDDVFAACSSLTEISIPDGVVSIGRGAFRGCSSLTGISIPEGVTNIGKSAFYYCSSLSGINIPKGVTSIEDSVFSGCSSLTEITIPNGVTSIGGAAFASCKSLTRISIPNSVVSVDMGAFSGSENLVEISISNSVTSIENLTFQRCSSLTEISIPNSVTSIGGGAFQSCSSLARISIPSSVTNIGNGAFEDCAVLSDVYYSGTEDQWENISIDTGNDPLLKAKIHYNNDAPDDPSKDYTYKTLSNGTIEITKYTGISTTANIPAQIDNKNVTGIGDSAFIACSTLTEVSIPDTVVNIGSSAFQECTSLAKINIPDKVTNIGSYAFFKCENLTEISIPNGLKSIKNDVFGNCTSLRQVEIPNSVTSIGDAAFYGCKNLTKVTMPESLTSIGLAAFCSSGLKELNLPNSVVSIGKSAFNYCLGLTEIHIPSSLTTITDNAFSECMNVTQVTIPVSVKSIEESAFSECRSLTDVYYSGTEAQWNEITIVEKGNEKLILATKHFAKADEPASDYEYQELTADTVEITQYKGSDTTVNIPAEIDAKKVTQIASTAFQGNKAIKEIIFPSGVTSIGSNSFSDCSSLTRVTISNGVTSISDGAFNGCSSLTGITLPDGVTNIGYLAFNGCSSLTEITLPNGVTSMGVGAFSDCSNLTGIVIPNSMTSIGLSVFNGCGKLREITIPSSITSIGTYAFLDCVDLSDVYYSSTKEQWEQIKIEENGNERLLNATIHFKESPIPPTPEEPILPTTTTAKEELNRLTSGDPLSLDPAFRSYLSQEQTDILESYLYTWLADINYTYQYPGSTTIRENIRKRSGINPQGDFASGAEQAITHISVQTKYGRKTIEITLDLGAPDSSGNLYPSYGAMRYEILPKSGVPSDVPASGQIGKSSYLEIAAFAASVAKTCEDSLHGTFQWQSLSDEMVSGILVDKTITEIIGNKNGSFSDGIFTIYAKPLFAYSKRVTIACPVDVYVYRMDGQEAGKIVNNKPAGTDENVRLDVDGDTKTVYLTGNDYYVNLRGTDTGTMRYEVEEIANEEVCRDVQFLELQLKKDMQYEGYVFRPLNIDSDLYALRTVNGPGSGEVTYADQDSLEPAFKKVQGMSLSQQNTSINADRTVQLNASFFPLDATNPNLVWISDNPSVAAVGSDGLVTAMGAGRATITVMTRDGSFLKQSCIVDVEGNLQQDPDHPTQNPDNPADPDNPSGNPDNPADPDNPSGNPDKPADSDHPSADPGSPSAKPGTPGSFGANTTPSTGPGSSGGTDGQPSKPEEDPKKPEEPSKDPGPVVAKLYYIVQFHANGGANLSRRTMTLLNDDTLGILPKVQRKAYLFQGWYTQQTGGARIYGDRKLNEATTLYARWTKAQAPAKAAVQAVKSAKKGQAKVSFRKVSGAAGYQVQYALNKKFKSAKAKTAGASAKAKTITGLKAGKKYYVRVRAYRLDSMGNKIYGAYSTAKAVKIRS